MQAILIYNGDSGGAEQTSAEDLQALLKEAGFDPVYKRTEQETDLDEALKGVKGLVIAAGGDGTLHAVAKRLIHAENDVSLAIVPMGTANNIAKSLGVEGSPEDVVKGLEDGAIYALDVGHVQGPWGEDYFLEAAGCGLFADILADYDPEEGKSPLRAADTLKEVLVDYSPKQWSLRIDDKDMSDCYVAVEVLNMKATGPRLKLAPDASPGDGAFDVALVLEPKDTNLFDYLGGLFTDSFPELENVEIIRAKTLSLAWTGEPIHIDDALRPEQVTDLDDVEQGAARRGEVTVTILAGALTLRLPERD